MTLNNKRICFISARSGFGCDTGLLMDHANGRLINELIGQGYISSVAFFSDPQHKKQYDLPIGPCKLYPLPFPHSYAGGFRNFFNIRKMLEIIEKDHDILIVQLPFPGFATLAGLRLPVVYHVCANVLSAADNKKKYSGLKSLAAVAFSRLVHNFHHHLFGKRNVRVIVNGSELARLYSNVNPIPVVSTSINLSDIIDDDQPPQATDRSVTNLLFIGRPSLQKGFDILVEALLMLDSHGENFKLTVIGFDKSYFSTTLEPLYLKSERIHSRIVFKGYMNWGEQMKSVIRDNHILVVPSRGGEGTPRVILECMSQGVITVASELDGIPDIIHDQWDGVLFYPLEPVNLFAKINGLIRDKALLEKLRFNGIQKSRLITVKHFADHFINAMRSMDEI